MSTYLFSRVKHSIWVLYTTALSQISQHYHRHPRELIIRSQNSSRGLLHASQCIENGALQKAAAFEKLRCEHFSISTDLIRESTQTKLKSYAVHHLFRNRPDGEQNEATDTKHISTSNAVAICMLTLLLTWQNTSNNFLPCANLIQSSPHHVRVSFENIEV